MIKIHPIRGEVTVEHVVGESSTHFILDKNSSITVNTVGIYEPELYNYNIFEIAGSIRSDKNWIEAAAIIVDGVGSQIVVAKTGSLDAYMGAVMTNSYEVLENRGHIHGTGMGVVMSGYCSTENFGTISGAVAIEGGSQQIHITNHAGGVIKGNSAAISFSSTADKTEINNTLVNGGLIESQKGFAVLGYGSNETIINRGTISGLVSLGGGNDSFDNRHGSVDHAIRGGAGDDTLIADNSKTQFVEKAGGGTDLVRSSASYVLSDNVENLTLLGSHDIDGKGNLGGNILSGNGGENRLLGKGGVDTLNGLEGNDMLSGGGGADLFLFADKTGHDTITDFQAGVDHIDLSGLSGVLDYETMIAKQVTTSGDDLVIHSGNDSVRLEHVALADLQSNDFYY